MKKPPKIKRKIRIQEGITEDNNRVVQILENIINDSQFSSMRLAALAKQISLDHDSIILIFKRRKIHFTLNSSINLFHIKMLRYLIMNEPIAKIPDKAQRKNPQKFHPQKAIIIGTPM